MTTITTNNLVKCQQNVNFAEMDNERSTGKNGFVLWGIFKEYIKQNIIVAVLRKSHSHSVVICRLIKKANNVKEDPRRKTDSNLDFSQLLSAHDVLIRRNVM